MQSWLGRAFALGLVLCSAPRSIAAPVEARAPRQLSLCAALLADEHFRKLGHLVVDGDPPWLGLTDATVLDPAVAANARAVRATRVFADEDVGRYFESAVDLARTFDGAVASGDDASAAFWTPPRQLRFAVNAALPALVMASLPATVGLYVLRPETFAPYAWPLALSYVVSGLVLENEFRTTARYLRATIDRGYRRRVIEAESPRATDVVDVVRHRVSVGGAGAAPILIVPVTENLGRLLFDAPAGSAHPTEVLNHRALIAAELARVGSNLDLETASHVLFVHLNFAETSSGRRTLTVGATMVERPASANAQ